MPAEPQLAALPPEELADLAEVLKSADLPHDDVAAPGRHFYRLGDSDGLLGFGGLELYGREALLRSVVMLDHRRGKGAGGMLVAGLTAEAMRFGVDRLWLLTTTAEAFFARLGFEAAARDAAPAPIRATREFRDICPASAACMMRRLHDRA